MPDSRQMQRALEQQFAMQRGYTDQGREPCLPPLPGCPLRASAPPALIEQLSAEVAALREQVAGLSRLSRSPALQSSPFAPLLAAATRSAAPAASPAGWREGLLRLQSPDPAALELRQRLDYLSRTGRLRRFLTSGLGQPHPLAYSA